MDHGHLASSALLIIQKFSFRESTLFEDLFYTLFQHYRVKSTLDLSQYVDRQSFFPENPLEHTGICINTFVNVHFKATEHDGDNPETVRTNLHEVQILTLLY